GRTLGAQGGKSICPPVIRPSERAFPSALPWLDPSCLLVRPPERRPTQCLHPPSQPAADVCQPPAPDSSALSSCLSEIDETRFRHPARRPQRACGLCSTLA